MTVRLARVLAGIGALIAIARPAGAEEGRLGISAGSLEADPELGKIAVGQHVVLTYGRYRVVSEHLDVKLEPDAVRIDGEGRVALCPCADPPVALAFRGARATRGGDLFVDLPRLEVLGVPVAVLPWIWLRAPDRVGLLPPWIAWRGDGGLIAGAGVHLPFPSLDRARPASLDLRGAGYVRGGFEVGAWLRTESSDLELSWDDLIHPIGSAPAGSRILALGRGEIGRASADATSVITYRVDAIRGDRGRSGTIDLAAAAKPFDSASVEASTRAGPRDDGVLATGITAVGPRGSPGVVAGPHATLGGGGTFADVGAWDAVGGGAVLRDPSEGGAVALARGTAFAEIDPLLGPFELRIGTLEGARVASPAREDPTIDRVSSYDAVATARAEIRLPLVRDFSASPGEHPLEHRIAPLVEVRGALASSSGDFFSAFAGPLARASMVSAAGVSSSIGRVGGGALALDLRGGALAEPDVALLPIAHARLIEDASIAALGLEAAGVGFGGGFATLTGTASTTAIAAGPPSGFALLARARLGRATGLALRLDAALQGGSGARQARAVADGSAAALPGEVLAYLRDRAASGGAELSIPWTNALRTTARLDADLIAKELLGARGGIGYRHSCGCLALDLFGSHRIGREGIDVWASVGLSP